MPVKSVRAVWLPFADGSYSITLLVHSSTSPWRASAPVRAGAAGLEGAGFSRSESGLQTPLQTSHRQPVIQPATYLSVSFCPWASPKGHSQNAVLFPFFQTKPVLRTASSKESSSYRGSGGLNGMRRDQARLHISPIYKGANFYGQERETMVIPGAQFVPGLCVQSGAAFRPDHDHRCRERNGHRPDWRRHTERGSDSDEQQQGHRFQSEDECFRSLRVRPSGTGRLHPEGGGDGLPDLILTGQRESVAERQR